MKTLKKISIALCLVGFPFLFCGNTPTPTTMDYLTAPSMWTDKYLNGDSYEFLRFTKTTVQGGMMIENVPHGGTSTFYLSDKGEHSTFDQTKVGKVKNGKYIVISDPDEPKIYEIKSINADSMVLFYDSKGKNTPNISISTFYARHD